MQPDPNQSASNHNPDLKPVSLQRSRFTSWGSASCLWIGCMRSTQVHAGISSVYTSIHNSDVSNPRAFVAQNFTRTFLNHAHTVMLIQRLRVISSSRPSLSCVSLYESSSIWSHSAAIIVPPLLWISLSSSFHPTLLLSVSEPPFLDANWQRQAKTSFSYVTLRTDCTIMLIHHDNNLASLP